MMCRLGEKLEAGDSSGESASQLDLRLKLQSRQMHGAFIADRDQHHHDGVTAGTADDGARRAGVDAQLGDCGCGTAVAAAADDGSHLPAEDGEQVAGDRIAVKYGRSRQPPVGPNRSVLIASGRWPLSTRAAVAASTKAVGPHT